MRIRRPARFRLAWRTLAVAGLLQVAVGLVLLPGMPRPAAAATDSGPAVRPTAQKTVTGPDLWDYALGKTGGQLSTPSSVTVSDATDLTSQSVTVSWKDFSPSWLSGAGQPYYGTFDAYTVMIAECKGADPQWMTDCFDAYNGGFSSIQDPLGWVGQPNVVFAITGADGTGSANISVENGLANSSLGCSPSQPCSLVVVPGQGGEWNNCSDHSDDLTPSGLGQPGWYARPDMTFPEGSVVGTGKDQRRVLLPNGPGNPIENYCSWQDRIVVPLSFQPLSPSCPSTSTVLSVAGSPTMANALASWTPTLCDHGHGIDVSYIDTDELSAVGDAVGGAATIGLTSRSAAADGIAAVGRHDVYAPVAVSAAAVAYWLDSNKTGQSLSGMDLNQDLMAKLLTASYTAAENTPCSTSVQPPNCDPDLDVHNPDSILYDPEFKQLNPGIVKQLNYNPILGPPPEDTVVPDVYGANSDMTWTTTSWIMSNSSAASFLAGKSDPGDVTVNTAYRGIGSPSFKGGPWPTNQFAALDPHPHLLELYEPVADLNTTTAGGTVVAFQALNEDAGSDTAAIPPCGNNQFNCTCPNYCIKDAPESVGDRALIAVLDEPDAWLNGFPVAALANAAGKYVQPTEPAMAAAVAHMTEVDGTLQVDPKNTDPAAYPLTMVVYAMVPTSGLSPSQASAAADFLDYAAKQGQVQGTKTGQLPYGYLPLPKDLAAQTERLAVDVKDQNGSTGNGGSTTPPSPSPGGTVGTPSPAPSVSLPAARPSTLAGVSLAAARSPGSGPIRFVLPLLLIVGGAAALGGSSVLLASAGDSTAAQLRRLRHVTDVRRWPATVRARASQAGSRRWHLTRGRKP